MIVIIFLTVVVLLIFFRYRAFISEIDADVKKVISGAPNDAKVIDEKMLKNLPIPVQRYLNYTGVIGKPIPRVVHLKQRGKIRKTANSSWMTIEAQQYYSTNPPGFVWKAFMPKKNLPVVLGRDEYLNGKGSILMKMFSIFTVADQKDKQMNEASLMRYLNEMMWFPQAYLGKNVSWRAISENSVEVTLTDRGKSVKANLYFDREGKLTNFSAQRYNTEARKIETWETPITVYGEYEGLKLPIEGKAIYRREDGDLEYINLKITYIKYD